MKTFGWLIRRELWENRAIWILPVIIASILPLLSTFANLNFDADVTRHSVRGEDVFSVVFLGIGALLIVVMSIYASWYLLDCLYSDRKDKSVLFWKSLPISDTSTVLSKLAIALVVIPAICLVLANLAAIAVAVVASIRMQALLSSSLWAPGVWLDLQMAGLFSLVTCALWFLPLYAWLMLMSAWAKRAPTLWAVLIPAGLCVLESIVLGSRHIWEIIASRLSYSKWLPFTHKSMSGANMHLDLLASSLQQFFMSSEMWLGVIVGVAFLAATIWIRRRTAES